MMEVRKASERGIGRSSWLDSRHTFSFSNYYDPKQVGFSDLLVINDDRVQPGTGFSTHPHQNMEIFSYVLEGALAHKDSMGTGSVIYAGDIQMMSAGTGILHSEFNDSDKAMVHFLQIWIIPDRENVKPRYIQKHFSPAEKRGKLKLVISPDESDGSLPVYQDIRIYAGLFDGIEAEELILDENRYAFVHVAQGTLTVNDQTLEEGDGVRIRRETSLRFKRGENAEILVFDMRPIEVPDIEW
ncbi:pirin family protein [Brucepastera parasyntrophica]|uniref:pirin family protein n=1 Tax=Brucepastera parasyntrophica TaxID=2880008 RepID=UPI00210E72AD|nr:pirin family protein [Brucepastera parasyntrophica]ULQ58784.1 pirin family protein [Brucepastera parasyntrophica]